MNYFKIGDQVKVSEENDNENYDDFREKTLTIIHVATNTDEHPGYDNGLEGEPLYDFKDEDGNEIPCSLYFYELEEA